MAGSDFEERFPARDSRVLELLGRNVRALRQARELTQEELAHGAGIEQNAVSLIENCRANPTIETVEALAICLGVRFVDLFDPKPRK